MVVANGRGECPQKPSAVLVTMNFVCQPHLQGNQLEYTPLLGVWKSISWRKDTRSPEQAAHFDRIPAV